MPPARSIPIVAALLTLLGALWMWWLQPPCPVRALTGVKCPACGISRALHAAMAGRWGEVFYWHALLIPGLLLLGTACVRPVRWPWWAAAGALLLVFTALRNLPVYLLY
ncbi:MAG: DUF2752 domain-containing protein [Verrucomicrobiaceae bacterium]|nr:MAG: DUF2752 domain-containing protein [Verrucomicrobiaceae bacterium]